MKVSVVTYNVLALQYATPHYFLTSDCKHVDPEYRVPLLCDRVEEWCKEGKIICLQEVDLRFSACLDVIFAKYKYYALRNVSVDNYQGVLTAFPLQEWDLEDVEHYPFSTLLLKSNKMIATMLHHKATNQVITVCNAHFPCAYKTPQIMNQCATNIQEFLSVSSEPWLLMGDFNSLPESKVYEILSETGTSIYKDMEPPATTFCNHPFNKQEFKGTLDYIFYSKEWKIHQLKMIPEPQEYLPNETEPSDHLPVECTFQL